MKRVRYVLMGTYGPLELRDMTADEAEKINNWYSIQEDDIFGTKYWRWLEV